MLSKEKMNRINELSKKSKSTGLSADEAKEQTRLRKEYLETFRQSMKGTIENTRIFDPDGNEVTPKKIQDIQNKKKH
ncbi:DUF896 domain-containing protein [Rossellomorea marisflavi]|jgi:uncharacterized protein YnzC (UPF0291/DUF896 family)|uniref:UPF0291 protein AF331_05895 n=1 Tax=Rossellomorea marisflavi TaxID=189381 RepID=A0A0M0GQ86_9BACI|nr:DUF896 domain-containing protein [Rossellomorea marisflavi]KQU60255.1 hypothetical protein ASG66_11385 [Bacillus sp. Leaf406]MBV6683377.1 DUF896 domain-containing protein [Bacillus sp. JRC01]VXC62790.1 conserved hypothetical protein [Bacillus sp. 349Y]KON91994.1 hypothetical protein AF331_05895 [Rossellomorea marisflavi]MCM2588821.1 DUF896 domain-containing protein [Rossellomorea marisflavi]